MIDVNNSSLVLWSITESVNNTRQVLWSMMSDVNTSCWLPTRERREAGDTTPHLALVRLVQPDSHSRANRDGPVEQHGSKQQLYEVNNFPFSLLGKR